MHYTAICHIESIYPTKLQGNTATNIEVIWKNMFSHARVIIMVIGVSSALNNSFVLFYLFIFLCLNKQNVKSVL